MNDEFVPVNVRVLEKDYQVACKPGEEGDAKRAAQYVDSQLRELRNRGNVSSSERMAVVAAMNIANELLQLQRQTMSSDSLSGQLEQMKASIDRALAKEVLETN